MIDFHKEKAEKVMEALRGGGADALLLFHGADIGFYTGFSIGPSERLAAALIPSDGESVLVVNELEGELRGQKPWIEDVDIWLEHEDPVETLAQNIERLGLEGAVIGLAEDAPWGWVNRLKDRLPAVHFVDASMYLGEVRMVKSQQELEWMRMACAITDRALEASFERLHTGMTEKELASILASEIQSLGGAVGFGLILFGERAALPHGQPSERKLEPGDATVFYGEPTDRQREIYQVVHDANRAAYEAVRPGVTCESLDEIARNVIEDAGFGEYFIHRLGHGIGLQGHERPYIVRNNGLELEPGMTFTIEPGIYVVGEIGVRVEDTVVCTTAGCESLTRLSRDLKSYPVRD
jgi:Xaa-Pro aminopeptidase